MRSAANARLALRLALRSLLYRRMMSFATVVGVAVGMLVVGAILILDHNTFEEAVQARRDAARQASHLRILSQSTRAEGGQSLSLSFERRGQRFVEGTALLPTQEGAGPSPLALSAPATERRGEEDYQAMRLAVRLASFLTFAVGAVIVFFTLRFSVASRSREFSLLLLLGERRANVALSLAMQALIFGVFGTAVGILLAFPAAGALLELDISTTGRTPMRDFRVPWGELATMASISIATAMAGVLGPVRTLYEQDIVDVLNPRFTSTGIDAATLGPRGAGWIAPPLLAGAYLVVRPFLQSWLSVVEFFALEVGVVGAMAWLTLWAVPPLLRGVIRVFEVSLEPLLRLETMLVARRMRLTSHKMVFTIASVTIVFGLVTALHAVTDALKREIDDWSRVASEPYAYFMRARDLDSVVDEASLQELLARHRIDLFRLSAKLPGEFPVRVIGSEELNRIREREGRRPLRKGEVIFSSTLAARFGVAEGDVAVVHGDDELHRFEIIEVADDVGFYGESAPYVDLKSFALVSEGNALLAPGLESTLGQFAMARALDSNGVRRTANDWEMLAPFYRFRDDGVSLGRGRTGEIDRDFLIFDLILGMAVLLATLGIANNLLIQVDARRREFSVLRTVGISRGQLTRLLLIEGGLIGLVGAVLATALGNAIGALSVDFLDRFTLFDYGFRISPLASIVIAAVAIASCVLAALYPARAAADLSSAESLHYE